MTSGSSGQSDAGPRDSPDEAAASIGFIVQRIAMPGDSARPSAGGGLSRIPACNNFNRVVSWREQLPPTWRSGGFLVFMQYPQSAAAIVAIMLPPAAPVVSTLSPRGGAGAMGEG
jgi:hypothetical protein